jgi:hypothetical protein
MSGKFIVYLSNFKANSWNVFNDGGILKVLISSKYNKNKLNKSGVEKFVTPKNGF